jgi:hypothetical protein
MTNYNFASGIIEQEPHKGLIGIFPKLTATQHLAFRTRLEELKLIDYTTNPTVEDSTEFVVWMFAGMSAIHALDVAEDVAESVLRQAGEHTVDRSPHIIAERNTHIVQQTEEVFTLPVL